MLRNFLLALLILIVSFSFFTEGYSDGRGRKVIVSRTTNKKATVSRTASKSVTVSRSTSKKVVDKAKVNNVTSKERLTVKFRLPVLRVEFRPIRPVTYAIWISGYWTWDYILNEWVWIPGFWNLYPLGSAWVSGYWLAQNDIWIWFDGYWRL